MNICLESNETNQIKKKCYQLVRVGLKSLHDDVISTLDDFFDPWDLSTATQMGEVCGPEEPLS